MYGPTTGDKVRLGDTNLFAEIEKDYTTYGEEIKFGGGKTIRDGMAQSASMYENVLDVVITNAMIIDYTGIYKADIGIKNGKIIGIGKAGNPDIQDNVFQTMVVGATTEVIAGEGQILTAGGIDTHIHFISPTQIPTALYSGITTMIGGGTGPAAGTNATTCTPGKWNIQQMLRAAEEYAMNLGFLGKGNSSNEEALEEQITSGALGLKIHEDWGSTPAARPGSGSFPPPGAILGVHRPAEAVVAPPSSDRVVRPPVLRPPAGARPAPGAVGRRRLVVPPRPLVTAVAVIAVAAGARPAA